MSDNKTQEQEQPIKDEPVVIETPPQPIVGGKVKRKKNKRTRRSSPYNDFKRDLMRSEEIKKIKPRARFKYISDAWKKQKTEQVEEKEKSHEEKKS